MVFWDSGLGPQLHVATQDITTCRAGRNSAARAAHPLAGAGCKPWRPASSFTCIQLKKMQSKSTAPRGKIVQLAPWRTCCQPSDIFPGVGMQTDRRQNGYCYSAEQGSCTGTNRRQRDHSGHGPLQRLRGRGNNVAHISAASQFASPITCQPVCVQGRRGIESVGAAAGAGLRAGGGGS